MDIFITGEPTFPTDRYLVHFVILKGGSICSKWVQPNRQENDWVG